MKIQKMDKPPYSNTGAETPNSNNSCLISLIDWVAFTIKDVKKIDKVLSLMGLELEDFIEMPTGLYGYKTQLRYGNIIILMDGHSSMGFHVEMSGQGVRELEEIMFCEWSAFFSKALELEAQFTRIDLAIDDRQYLGQYGYFTVQMIIDKIMNGECVSRFKIGRRMNDYDLENGAEKSSTIYIGSPTSRIRIRIYDKALESKTHDGHWVRTEIQARNERSQEIAENISTGLPVGELTAGILNNYVSFKIKGSDTHRHRWETEEWWENFIGDVDKIKLSKVQPEKTMADKIKWIEHQISPTLALVKLHYDNDNTYLNVITELGKDKLSKRHLQLLDRKKMDGLKNIHWDEIQTATL